MGERHVIHPPVIENGVAMVAEEHEFPRGTMEDRVAAIVERSLDRLSARVAELERQRGAVLALHQQIPGDPTKCGICHQADQSCGCCGSWDENDRWPCKTVEIYGGGQ